MIAFALMLMGCGPKKSPAGINEQPVVAWMSRQFKVRFIIFKPDGTLSQNPTDLQVCDEIAFAVAGNMGYVSLFTLDASGRIYQVVPSEHFELAGLYQNQTRVIGAFPVMPTPGHNYGTSPTKETVLFVWTSHVQPEGWIADQIVAQGAEIVEGSPTTLNPSSGRLDHMTIWLYPENSQYYNGANCTNF